MILTIVLVVGAACVFFRFYPELNRAKKTDDDAWILYYVEETDETDCVQSTNFDDIDKCRDFAQKWIEKNYTTWIKTSRACVAAGTIQGNYTRVLETSPRL